MKIIKKILTVIFNPLSLVLGEKSANDKANFMARHSFLAVFLAAIITALIILICNFL